MGINFHTPSPPTDVYCPNAVSNRNSGIPANTRVVKYGMRKAPKNNVIQNALVKLVRLKTSMQPWNTKHLHLDWSKLYDLPPPLLSNSKSPHIKHVNSLIRATLIGVSKVSEKKKKVMQYCSTLGKRQWVLFSWKFDFKQTLFVSSLNELTACLLIFNVCH